MTDKLVTQGVSPGLLQLVEKFNIEHGNEQNNSEKYGRLCLFLQTNSISFSAADKTFIEALRERYSCPKTDSEQIPSQRFIEEMTDFMLGDINDIPADCEESPLGMNLDTYN